MKLEGRKFGNWKVLEEAGTSVARKRLILVQCKCGFEKVTQAQNILNGASTQCLGCSRKKLKNRRVHGEASKRTAEYRTWKGMRGRCLQPKNPSYPRYGGSGITVCERWSGTKGYENFLHDMGRRPSKKHSLDRIDNRKGYSPENCKWSTPSAQRRNQLRYKRFHPSEDTVFKALMKVGFTREEATRAMLEYSAAE